MPRRSTSFNWRDAPDPGSGSSSPDGFFSSDDEGDTPFNVTEGLLKRQGDSTKSHMDNFFFLGTQMSLFYIPV